MEDYWGQQQEELRNALRNPLLDYFTKTIPDQSYISYLAFYKDQAVAVGGIVFREQPGGFKNPSGKVAYVMNMYTKPEFRKQGLAGKILNLLTEDAVACGYKAFELHATKEGEPLYIREGFTLHPEPTYRKII